jgi:hypothetical protein
LASLRIWKRKKEIELPTIHYAGGQFSEVITFGFPENMEEKKGNRKGSTSNWHEYS